MNEDKGKGLMSKRDEISLTRNGFEQRNRSYTASPTIRVIGDELYNCKTMILKLLPHNTNIFNVEDAFNGASNQQEIIYPTHLKIYD